VIRIVLVTVPPYFYQRLRIYNLAIKISLRSQR